MSSSTKPCLDRLRKFVPIGIGGSIPVIFFFILAWPIINGRPFEMRLFPNDGNTTVQFAMPSKGLVSPTFPVNLSLDQAKTLELRSDSIPIEGCAVEARDTTVLPGMYRIRIGTTHFYLSEVIIRADDEEFRWEPSEVTK